MAACEQLIMVGIGSSCLLLVLVLMLIPAAWPVLLKHLSTPGKALASTAQRKLNGTKRRYTLRYGGVKPGNPAP